MGHLDGLLSTADSLFLADMSHTGSLGGDAAGAGVIYQITPAYVVSSGDQIFRDGFEPRSASIAGLWPSLGAPKRHRVGWPVGRRLIGE